MITKENEGNFSTNLNNNYNNNNKNSFKPKHVNSKQNIQIRCKEMHLYFNHKYIPVFQF